MDDVVSLAYGRSRVKAVRASGINSRDYRHKPQLDPGTGFVVVGFFVCLVFFSSSMNNEFPTLALFFQCPELTTWFKVMTRSRVSLQLFTRASGKQGSMSFSSVNMCSVVVASREPGRQRGVLVLILLFCPHFPSTCPGPDHLTPRLLNLLDAELGSGDSSRMVGRGLFTKHEITALEN